MSGRLTLQARHQPQPDAGRGRRVRCSWLEAWPLSELGLELVDLVHSLLELGVCRVLADTAHGPAQDLRAAVRDACGDQGVHGRQIGRAEPGHYRGEFLRYLLRCPRPYPAACDAE